MDNDALPPCLRSGPTRRTFLKQAGLLVVTGTLGAGLFGCDSGGGMGDDGGTGNPGGGGNGGGNGGSGSASLSVEGNTLRVDLARRTELNQAGGFLLVTRVSGVSVRALIVNVDGNAFKSFTSVCTHEGCDVETYNPDVMIFECLCHGSQYNIDGQVVRGPATGALEAFSVSRSGDILSIVFR